MEMHGGLDIRRYNIWYIPRLVQHKRDTILLDTVAT